MAEILLGSHVGMSGKEMFLGSPISLRLVFWGAPV